MLAHTKRNANQHSILLSLFASRSIRNKKVPGKAAGENVGDELSCTAGGRVNGYSPPGGYVAQATPVSPSSLPKGRGLQMLAGAELRRRTAVLG